MTAALSPFEADVAAVLDIADDSTRASALAALAKHLPGKHDQSSHGRGGGAVSAAVAQETLLTQLDITPAHPVRVAAGSVDELMDRLAQGEPINLERVQVTGQGNENMFARHATETPRAEMPQLPTTVATLDGFMSDLEARGVDFGVRHGVDPRSLHATQSELDGKKVGSMYGAVRAGTMSTSGTVIIASREGAVLDGHHRWAAVSAARVAGMDVSITVLTVDMPIVDLLQVAQTHSGQRRGMGDLPATVAASLSEWELDLWTALGLADVSARAGALALLAKHLPGKHDQSSHGHGTATAEFAPTQVSGETFHEGMAQARAGDRGAFLTLYTPEEYAGMKCFQAEGGKVGGALKDHGDGRVEIVSLYNNGGSRGAGLRMFDHLTGEGGNYAECMGDGLRSLYQGRGFRVTGSFPFDRTLAAADWDSDRFDEPTYYTLAAST